MRLCCRFYTMKLAALLLLHLPALLAVELVVGSPKTKHVSEPFSDSISMPKARCMAWSSPSRMGSSSGPMTSSRSSQASSTTRKSKNLQGDVFDGSDPLKAVFNGMHDIQITKEGNAIIGDSFNHRVRLLELPSGKVSTLAGNGKTAFAGDGGPAIEASFNITMTATLSPDGSTCSSPTLATIALGPLIRALASCRPSRAMANEACPSMARRHWTRPWATHGP